MPRVEAHAYLFCSNASMFVHYMDAIGTLFLDNSNLFGKNNVEGM